MDSKQIKLFQSQNSDNWATTLEIFQELDKEFNFNYDPCPLNSLIDSLNVDWRGRVFCNPPYSKVKEFMEKGEQELNKGNVELIVYLVFANTDTKWFHTYINNKAEVRFIKGRLGFDKHNEEGERIETKGKAMRPSIICILRRPNNA